MIRIDYLPKFKLSSI